MATPPLPLIAVPDENRPLLLQRGEPLRLTPFLTCVANYAEQLRHAQVIVNLCTDRTEFALAFCAALERGIANVLPPDALDETVQRLRGEYEGAVVVRGLHIEDLLRPSDSTVSHARAAQNPVIAAPQVAAIPFTSGSTGASQPHAKRWAAMCFVAQQTERRLFADVSPYYVLATVPSQHMYGLETTLMLALQGHGVFAGERPLLPADIRDQLKRLPEPRVLVSTPVHLRALVRAGVDLPALHRVISATAPLDADLARAVEQRFGCAVFEIYGCTEAGTLATRRTVNDAAWHLLDGVLIEADAAEPESAWVTGPHLQDPIRLPDAVDVQDSEHFRLLARHSDLVNVAGKRASLADLTHKLCSVAGVQDGVVFVPESAGEVVRLAGLVVTTRTEREIADELAKLVDAAFIPRPLLRVDAIPRNHTGKVLRARVLALAQRVASIRTSP